MKRKLLALCFATSFVTAYAGAILPPLYHTLAEFKAIVEAPELTESLQSGEAIISITREENLKFTVLTNKHKLIVDIIYEHTDKIGPAKFHLQFQQPEPLTP